MYIIFGYIGVEILTIYTLIALAPPQYLRLENLWQYWGRGHLLVERGKVYLFRIKALPDMLGHSHNVHYFIQYN